MLMFEKNSESDYVRNQQQGHYHSGKEECGSQLPRQQSRMIGLVESIEQIG
jgi:hypothetical protein